MARLSAAGRIAALAAFALLAACQTVPPPAPLPPPPPPAPSPPPPSPPPPVVVAPERAWDVAPPTPGNWGYKQDQQGTAATFGPPDTEGALEIRCRLATHEIAVSRLGSAGQAGVMTIRTSAGDLKWPAIPSRDGLEMMAAVRPARDPGFDWIGYSRGRFSVEVPGLARLIVPAWAEISRVIEDCRG